MRNLLSAALLAIALAAPAAPVAAQPASPLQLEGYVKLEKIVVDPSGESRIELVDPQTVVPGDRLIMGTRYRNQAAAAVADITVSNPVPAALTVSELRDPAQIVSVDGGKTWGPLAAQVVRAADGTERPAQPGDITHLRWTIPTIAPGEGGSVEYVATVR